MASIPPFHSDEDPTGKIAGKVYHDNDQCSEANKIPLERRVAGTGDRARCQLCSLG